MDLNKCRSMMVVCLLAGLLGCGTKVRYGNPEAVETLTPTFGSTDLQMIAAKMAQSLLASPVIQEGHQPVILVSTIRNKTEEHIDTKAITDKIRTTLLQSGKVRFAAGEVRQEIIDELEYQERSGYVNPETSKKIGKQVGADYLLTGDISAIKKERGSTKDYYYRMTLNLDDLETGLISWADEKEIRKTEE
jgi:uncharacterized protein (TIGR02722 family)